MTSTWCKETLIPLSWNKKAVNSKKIWWPLTYKSYTSNTARKMTSSSIMGLYLGTTHSPPMTKIMKMRKECLKAQVWVWSDPAHQRLLIDSVNNLIITHNDEIMGVFIQIDKPTFSVDCPSSIWKFNPSLFPKPLSISLNSIINV